MKKLFVCLVLALCCFASNAQIVKKSYRELKTMYNPRNYVATFSDKYSPGWSAVGSLVIPGLGDAICGEWGRAATQFLGSSILTSVGSSLVKTGCATTEDGTVEITDEKKLMGAAACYLGAFAIDIWSIVDAVRVAKVKNMYIQDATRTSSLDIKLSPSFAYVNTGRGVVPSTGFSLNVIF